MKLFKKKAVPAETTDGKKPLVRVGVLIAAVLIPLLTGVFSAFLTAEDMRLFDEMTRPPLAPPAWLFPIAWTLLYILMGGASYFVFTAEADAVQKRKALYFYAAQLIMNFFWSTLFFTYERFLIALIWLLIMWVLILICTVLFYRISHPAGYMLLPLFIWTSFAAYLNLAYYIISLRSPL